MEEKIIETIKRYIRPIITASHYDSLPDCEFDIRIRELWSTLKDMGVTDGSRKNRHLWRYHYPDYDYRTCKKCGEVRLMAHVKVEPCPHH